MANVLTADLGGTRTRVALVDEAGRILARQAAPTLAHQGRDSVLSRLVKSLEQVASGTETAMLAGIGISVASPVDPETGVMYGPPNLPGWHGFSIKAALEERLPHKVTVANDASLAALGEHVYGAGRGYRHLIYLTVSTGIGGGIIVDGSLYLGAGGFAGEMGHITIERDGPVCGCGNRGCLETLASGTAVARMARERIASGQAGTLLERAGGDPEKIDARTVAEAASFGDELARSIMEEAAANLGVGVVSLLHAFDPEVIVLGGGMAESFDLLADGIRQQIDERAMAQYRGRFPVVKSGLGDDAGLLGAAALALRVQDD